MLTEINVDALVGPTHHFGGLGVGNVASQQHATQSSNPKKAALEGLAKAYQISKLGVPQFIWLPPERTGQQFLSQLGFQGSLAEQLTKARDDAPRVLSAAFSSAFMWAANSCTFTPAVDATDQKNHFTPANLISSWHRGTEHYERQHDIQQMFGNLPGTVVHSALPSLVPLRDEGAANHMRLSGSTAGIAGEQDCGVNIFVHGEQDIAPEPLRNKLTSSGFYPRHTLAASQAIARHHRLDQRHTFFLHQHPDAIAAGVFHNDVIATSHKNVLIHHEKAFLDAESELERLERVFGLLTGKQTGAHTGVQLKRIVVSEAEFPLQDAVQSYFFNSQIISPADLERPTNANEAASMVLVCPEQCKQIPSAQALIQRLIASNENPIVEAHFFSLNESMANGGGPACLRLRVQVPEDQLDLLDSSLRLDDRLFEVLSRAIEETYPTVMNLDLLADPEQIAQCSDALKTLRQAILRS